VREGRERERVGEKGKSRHRAGESKRARVTRLVGDSIQLFLFFASVSLSSHYRDLEIPSTRDVLDLHKSSHLPPSPTHLPRFPDIPDYVHKVRRRDQRSQQRPDEERYQPYDDNSPQREPFPSQPQPRPRWPDYPPPPRPFHLLLAPRGQPSSNGRVNFCHQRCGVP
jgi:hypothetical protein